MAEGKKWWIAGAILFIAAALGIGTPGTAPAGDEEVGVDIVSHEVSEKDNLYIIAGYYYKDPRQWRRIFDRNRDTIANPNLIVPGTVLEVQANPAKQWEIPYSEFVSRIYR